MGNVKLFNKMKCYLGINHIMEVKLPKMFILRPLKSFDFAFLLLMFTIVASAFAPKTGTQVVVNEAIFAAKDCKSDLKGTESPVEWEDTNKMSFVGPINSSRETKSVRLSSLIPKETNSKFTQKEILDFLAHGKFLERAMYSSQQTTIPVSVLIAQTILESNLGKSELTRQTGNLGNIKCSCNRNPELRARHDKSNRSGNTVCVRGYDKIERSNDWYEVIPSGWEDWNRRIGILTKYRVVKNALGKGYSWERWTQVLHKSPYATDSRYGEKLDSIIRAYTLYELDDLMGVKITSDNGKYVFWNPDSYK